VARYWRGGFSESSEGTVAAIPQASLSSVHPVFVAISDEVMDSVMESA